jgi:general secretion pathway protein G
MFEDPFIPPKPKSKLPGWIIDIAILFFLALILFAVCAPRGGSHQTARRPATIADMRQIVAALQRFHTDTGRYPTSAEGLLALLAQPPNTRLWHGPYLSRPPTDKWGIPYLYLSPGTDHPDSFDLTSSGPNGVPNDDDDITQDTEY